MRGEIAVVCLLAADMAFGAADFVRNGSFEEKGGWSPDGKVYSFDAHGGQNGSGGLKWENDDPKAYRLISQSLKLKTGMKYRYSCRVKQSGIKSALAKKDGMVRNVNPLGAAICVAWNDEKGNWIAEVSKSQKAVDCDWTELVGETPPMPANAKSFNVCLYVCRGCTGRVWFDDVSVVQGEIPPVSFLTSSAYRDLAADGEDVEFRAVLKIDADQTPLKDLKAAFTPEQYPNRCRLPTAEEARSMSWQSIAGGANGLVYWAYHYVYWKLKGEAYDKFYGAYCAVGEEVKRFIPVILSVEPCAAVVKAPENLACRIWKFQDRTYLLVCNTTNEPVAGEIVLSRRFRDVHGALDPAEPALKGDRLGVSLKPMGVSMLRLED